MYHTEIWCKVFHNRDHAELAGIMGGRVSDIHSRRSGSAMDRGPDPRVLRSRQAALSAVQEILAEHGWTGVTHVAVAARSGVGRTTLYRHWPDVRALLFDAIVQQINQVRREPTGD